MSEQIPKFLSIETASALVIVGAVENFSFYAVKVAEDGSISHVRVFPEHNTIAEKRILQKRINSGEVRVVDNIKPIEIQRSENRFI